MKLIHLSDLHLGKRVNEISLLEDQEYILDQIIEKVETEHPQAVILAGDIYDKAVPSAEAVRLFDRFLYRLAAEDRSVFVISGNHDSPERVAFGARLMVPCGVYLSPVYEGAVAPVRLVDANGPVDFYMLPFVRPAHVRRFFPQEEIRTFSDALRVIIQSFSLDPLARNVLITHQFVAGATLCESEDISVGGVDAVDVSIFDSFDYVALGHLHSPQNMRRDSIRYCGSPLKYSFSEVRHKKSLTVVELEAKGQTTVRTAELIPLRDMAEYKGRYLELTARSFYLDLDTEAYIHITLTDEEDIPDAIGKLRTIYPNIMKLDYDNLRTRSGAAFLDADGINEKDPLEVFADFYERQNDQELAGEARAFTDRLVREIWEEAQ